MRDWRTILRPDLDGYEDRAHGQYGQNRQRGGDSVNSVHISKARHAPTSPDPSQEEAVVPTPAAVTIESMAKRSDVVLEPAASNARPVFWEDATGQILGPAVPEYLGRTGSGHMERFWVIVTYEGSIRWIRDDRLRRRPVSHP